MRTRLALLLAFSLVSACSTAPFPLAERAAAESLIHRPVRTSAFEHSVYEKRGDDRYQVVFIEGDGRPWIEGGTVPAHDPTPHDALAFDLMLATPARAYYLTRPCYFETWTEACTADLWTSGRYSGAVVASLAEAIRATTDGERPLILVGYSGGGALAVLLATELDGVHGIVTVAGLLDTDAWTAHHGYEPLDESINPAAIRTPVRRLHLHGAGDTVVPIEQTRLAVAALPDSSLRVFDDYDHVCCWRRDWPDIWREVEAALGLAR